MRFWAEDGRIPNLRDIAKGALGDRRVPAGLFSMADPGSNFNVNDAMNCFLEAVRRSAFMSLMWQGIVDIMTYFLFLRWQETTWFHKLGLGMLLSPIR
jgi:hypothetical protein